MSAHWLKDTKSALKWARKNYEDVARYYDVSAIVDLYSTNRGTTTRDSFKELLHRISEYSKVYNTYLKEGKAEIYRMIDLPADVDPIDGINWKHVGEHWSFLRDGAGVYLGSEEEDARYYLIEAEVPFDCVNWEAGFVNYLAWGDSEFECTLESGCKILIKGIHEVSEKMFIHGSVLDNFEIEPFEAVS